ncbi:MAG: hypothetical protein EHM70_13295 [Chloroflexota bacterium]|nr:MAG: hypothetical protein EHM70_13295 [Chloroflexota bacterium]
MSSLSDRLKSLGVKVGAQDLPAPQPRRGPGIEAVVPGRVHQTSNGETYIIDSNYPPDYRYGNLGLSFSASLATLAEWVVKGNRELHERLCQCSPQAFAFLDIETTGLQGGTGTYAFLVGVGRLEEGGFHLAQFFLRDPIEEQAQLLALEEFLGPCQALVTYNGKAFDVPLLNTRYLIQGWKTPLPGLMHVDLLPVARKLWRERLPSRTLGNIETFILGARRTQEDVPGWMIPQMYFDYLRTGDAHFLEGIFYHNAMDVLAMAALLNHVTFALEDPTRAALEKGEDLIGMAKMYEDMGRMDEAVALYQQSLEHELPGELYWNTVERLSFIKKRMGDYPGAIALWQQAAGQKQIYACVELAKYYEHQMRDYTESARWTQAALDIIHAPGYPRYARQEWNADLLHRLDRLKKKM